MQFVFPTVRLCPWNEKKYLNLTKNYVMPLSAFAKAHQNSTLIVLLDILHEHVLNTDNRFNLSLLQNLQNYSLLQKYI